MAEALDARAVRHWCRVSLSALGHAREEIDALNVYPVPDGDTGTNLYLTMEAATAAAEASPDDQDLAHTLGSVVTAAMLGARGNSGVILSQLLRGFAAGLGGAAELDGRSLARAMRIAARAGYAAVAVPVEGTILTVAKEAATSAELAAQSVGEGMAGLAFVAQAAAKGAGEALVHTPEQLEVLRRAGVVDAGGRGLCLILDALVNAITDTTPVSYPVVRLPRVRPAPARDPLPELPGPDFEVMYLLDADDSAIPALEKRLASLGDSLVVAGGDRLWNIHVHVDDPGAAVEAGVEAGRPHRIHITSLRAAVAARRAGTDGHRDHPAPAGVGAPATETAGISAPVGPGAEPIPTKPLAIEPLATEPLAIEPLATEPLAIEPVDIEPVATAPIPTEPAAAAEGTGAAGPVGAGQRGSAAEPVVATESVIAAQPTPRAVVAVAAGPGIASLFRDHGARVVDGGPGRQPATADLLAGIAAAGTGEVVLLPNDGDARAAAEAAAARARADGRRVTVIPTRSSVQGLAALAVHEPSRAFDEDVVAMSSAASGTGHGEVTIAVREAITSAGVCRPGQVLGLVDDDIVLIGDDLFEVAYGVLTRLLARGGELVTLVTGNQAPADLAPRLRRRLRAERPDLECVTYAGGQDHYPLLIGVE
ncbi:MAG TPA: DAK2 domain-containing protein [Actinomycetes bacterium]|nr:DAK2 domain-containing protein [Actinomycetes bacterium]